ELETRDAEQAAGRRSDFGREVGERRDVVTGFGGRLRELAASELHSVAGIAREANNDSLQMLGFHRCGGPYQYSGVFPRSKPRRLQQKFGVVRLRRCFASLSPL